MALNFNGTVVLIAASKLPTGFTKPTVTVFSDGEYQTLNYIANIAKSAVENSDELITVNNILNDASVGINKQVTDKLTSDLDVVSNTIDAFAQLTSIESNQKLGDDIYNDTACSYRCKVTVKFKYA